MQTEKQRGVQCIHQPEGQNGCKIGDGIDHRMGKTVAHTENAQRTQTEEEQVLQIGRKSPPEYQMPALLHIGADAQQQGVGNHQQSGNQAVAKTGCGVGNEPVFPPQGQGMEGIAQPGVVKIAPQQLHIQKCVDKIDDGHHLGQIIQRAVETEGGTALPQQRHAHKEADGVENPAWRKPGQILFENGFIKE